VRTDHAALQWLRKTPEPIGQQSRWLEVLEEFHFTVEHRPGKSHANADALSRHPCRQFGMCTTHTDALNVCALQTGDNNDRHEVWSSHAIKRAQKEDPDIGPLYQALANHKEKPRWETILSASQETKVYWTQWDRLTCLDGILYRRYSPPNSCSEIRQMQIFPAYRHEVLQQAQQGFTGGHMGERRILEQVRRRGYWPGWGADALTAGCC